MSLSPAALNWEGNYVRMVAWLLETLPAKTRTSHFTRLLAQAAPGLSFHTFSLAFLVAEIR